MRSLGRLGGSAGHARSHLWSATAPAITAPLPVARRTLSLFVIFRVFVKLKRASHLDIVSPFPFRMNGLGPITPLPANKLPFTGVFCAFATVTFEIRPRPAVHTVFPRPDHWFCVEGRQGGEGGMGKGGK